jgi:DNA transformation protein
MLKDTKQAERLAKEYVERLWEWAQITTRPLFGSVGLYRDGQVFGIVWHGALYFKVDGDSRAKYESAGSHALGYVSGGKERALKSYWEVPVEVLDDDDTLRDWAQRAFRAALNEERPSAITGRGKEGVQR